MTNRMQTIHSPRFYENNFSEFQINKLNARKLS